MNIAHRLTETLTVKRLTARTATGDGTRGTTLTMVARIERARSVVPVAGGNALDNGDRVFTLEEILPTDHLYFPEDSGQTNARRPTKIDRMVRLDGTTSHYETLV